MLLPELRQRADISELIGDTVDKKDGLFTLIKKAAKSICDVPLLAGMIPMIAVLYGLGFDRSTGVLPGYSFEEGAAIFAASYAAGIIGMSMIKQYAMKRRAVIDPENKNKKKIGERLKHGLLNNPHLGGLAMSIAYPASIDFISKNIWFDQQTREPNWFYTGMFGYIAGYYLVEIARNNEFVKRGFENFRRRKVSEGEKIGLAERIYNYPLEHPQNAGALVGVAFPTYIIAYALVNSNGHANFANVPALMYVGLALYSGILATIAYLGTSAVSWFLHSNSLKLMQNSLMQNVNSISGDIDAAINNQRWVMEIPTTPANERKNHFRLGDLYMRNGNLEDALDEYYKALQLVGKKGQIYSNPIDAILGMADSVNVLKLFGEVRNLKYRTSTDRDEFVENLEFMSTHFPEEYEQKVPPKTHRSYLSVRKGIDRSGAARLKRFVRQVRNSNFSDADRTLRLVVRSEPRNPEFHLFYAKFLEVMGDKNLAAEEYNTTIRLLVGNPEIAGNFERIDVSRNEVLTYKADKFLNKTLIFKRSRNRQEIEKEYASLCYFHERLGERVAKPLTMFEQGDMTYLIMEHSGEKTLHDLAEEGRLTYETLSEAVELLCEVQRVGSEHETGA